jgi:hypothetical protein
MSYSEAEKRVQNDYLLAVEAGAVTPALSLLGSLNFVILIIWLMVCGSVSDSIFQRSRLPVFVFIACISLWNLLYTRSIGVLGSISVGLNSVLCTITALNYILLHDPRSFRRIVLSPIDKRKEPSGPQDTHNHDSKLTVTWESMPQSIPRRIFWVLDLLSGFRGVHWVWNSKPLPPFLPALSNPSSKGTILLRNAFHFIIDYLLIDLAKCLMIADPFFINYPGNQSTTHITPYITSSLGLYTYRMLLCAAGVFIAVDLISTFTMLLQVNILGPEIIGLNAFPILFPPIWGSPRAVLIKGLRGFWGETWHQMFRKQFTSVGDAITDAVLRTTQQNIQPQKTSKVQNGLEARTLIRTLTVFLLAGILHAAASYTLLGPTRPWASFAFFALQPLGIAIQSTCSWFFVFDRTSHWKVIFRQISNLIFTMLWLWTTSGLLLNDLTSGGMWIFEPIPVSFIRGLGFSKKDQRWWCW